jgi:TP901 family phage tail tape measure protein
MVMATKAAATFQDSLLELKAATASLTPEQYDKVRAAALHMSKELKVGPADAAKAITLLVKAGMPMEEALGGAGKAAIEFARVAEVDVAQAAEFMKVSMNVFGISAQEASNTLSAAADASETNIAQMVEAFPQIASVAKGTGQSLFGLAQAIAVLARYGMTGEEAGTGIKTVLTKLLAPTEQAKQAMASLGLSMESFVDASGKLLPISQIATIFEKKLGGMSKTAREAMLANEALVNVFDVRGIKVIQAFADAGQKGFGDIATEMENARTVAEKYAIMMEGLTGFFAGLYAAVMRLADAFGTALAPSLSVLGPLMGFLIDSATWLLANVPGLATVLATTATALTSIGGGMLLLGGGASLISKAFDAIIKFGPMVVAALARVRIAMLATAKSLKVVMANMGPVGWGLLATGAAIEAYMWMTSGDDIEKEKKLTRDEEKQSLAAAGGGVPTTAGQQRGDTYGTFGGSALGQLGIGASITATMETAVNTARIADTLDDVKKNTEAAAEIAQSTMKTGSANVRGGVAAVSERGLLSATERTALGVERIIEMIREATSGMSKGGATFA